MLEEKEIDDFFAWDDRVDQLVRNTRKSKYVKKMRKELKEDFEVLGFLAPYISCIRRSDKLEGSMLFQHMPRFYFSFIDINGFDDNGRELKRKMDAGEKVTIGEMLGIKTEEDVKIWSEKFAERLRL